MHLDCVKRRQYIIYKIVYSVDAGPTKSRVCCSFYSTSVELLMRLEQGLIGL